MCRVGKPIGAEGRRGVAGAGGIECNCLMGAELPVGGMEMLWDQISVVAAPGCDRTRSVSPDSLPACGGTAFSVM